MDKVSKIIKLKPSVLLSNRVHYAKNNETLCGITIDDNWWVLYDKPTINCSKCLKFGAVAETV